MPIYASAFFIPTSASIPYILEDIYQKGGYRSVATLVDRDAIKTAARKQGMLCYVREDQTIYWLPDTVVAGAAAWKKFDVTQYVNFVWNSPLSMDESFNVSIDEKRIVPVIVDEQAGFALFATAEGPVWKKFDVLPDSAAASMGDALMLDAEKKPIWGASKTLPATANVEKDSTLLVDDKGEIYWGQFSGLPSADGLPDGKTIVLRGGKPVWGDGGADRSRSQINIPIPALEVGEHHAGAIDVPGSSLVMLRVMVPTADYLLQIFGTAAYDEATNPYTFMSSSLKGEDDGTTIDADGKIVYHRRYSIFSNRDDRNVMYIKVTNKGTMTRAATTVSLIVVPLE